MDINEISNIKFYCDDLGCEVTVKVYLKELLATLWKQGEGFSSKRPFGNSGWECDLGHALLRGGAIDGLIDDNDEIVSFNGSQAVKVISDVINNLN